MTNGHPRRVDPGYSSIPPAEPSPRTAWWTSRIKAGWRPNRRISTMGYEESAEFFGVTTWEYLNVISPLLRDCAECDADPVGYVRRWQALIEGPQ